MSDKFSTLLKVTKLAVNEWILEADLIFNDSVHGRLKVPRLTEINFTPLKSLRYIIALVHALLMGVGASSFALHEHLYREQRLSRKACDDVLRRALKSEGLPVWRTAIVWALMRAFAAKAYTSGDDDGSSPLAQMVG